MSARDPRLLSCREVERLYRLRHGVASAMVRSGALPARRRGRAIMVSAKRAAELFGL